MGGRKSSLLVAALLIVSFRLQATAEEPPSDDELQGPLKAEVTVVSRVGGPDPGVTMRVVTREEIDAIPARTLPELLQTLPGVDVRRRGVEGIQADIGIRGADHDGTLILVDGEPVNDSQTNHFSADLDVPLDAVERIEVFAGAASALYGSGAIGGVVNIVTRGARLGRARAQLEGRYAHGSSSLDAGSLRVASRIGDNASVAVDAGRAESSGFRDDTEYQTRSLRVSGRLETGAGPIQLTLGYGAKEFGAYAFYGTAYPNQRESTSVKTGHLWADLAVGGWVVTPSASFRGHHDDFVLDRDRPAFYENVHDTEATVGRLLGRHEFLGGTAAVGAEAGSESIASRSLGDHSRGRQALFGEWARPFQVDDAQAGGVRLGLRWDRYEDYGSRLSPLASAWITAGSEVKLRASAGSAFRIPTFTDLYYRDPQTAGDAGLQPEQAWNAEVGATWTRGRLSLDVAGFTRHGTDLIDYVRTASTSVYSARNIRTVDTSGIEATAELRTTGIPLLSRVVLQASYLFSDLAKLSSEAGGAVEGRYLLDPVHTRWDLIGSGVLPFQVTWRSRLTYYARPSFENGAWLLDARLGRQLLEGDIVEVYVEGEDLGDAAVEERPGVPSPGRRIAAGIHLTW
jgi:iron complex outermembrane receptor protein